jgi:hypothetical protein
MRSSHAAQSISRGGGSSPAPCLRHRTNSDSCASIAARLAPLPWIDGLVEYLLDVSRVKPACERGGQTERIFIRTSARLLPRATSKLARTLTSTRLRFADRNEWHLPTYLHALRQSATRIASGRTKQTLRRAGQSNEKRHGSPVNRPASTLLAQYLAATKKCTAGGNKACAKIELAGLS